MDSYTTKNEFFSETLSDTVQYNIKHTPNKSDILKLKIWVKTRWNYSVVVIFQIYYKFILTLLLGVHRILYPAG